MNDYYYLSPSLSPDSLIHSPSPDFPEAAIFPSYSIPLPINSSFEPDQLGLYDIDLVSETLRLLNSDVSGSCISERSSYGSLSSLSSYETQKASLIQRSVSSQSLQKNNAGFKHGNVSSVSGFSYSEGPLRKVYSAGDLQRQSNRSESPLLSESSMIIEGMSKACRYSPEEKKERIERYRSKRNQRNFTKKIKYVCRKTLADSRPRIRGRFARNEETEKSSPLQGERPEIEKWKSISRADFQSPMQMSGNEFRFEKNIGEVEPKKDKGVNNMFLEDQSGASSDED